MCVVHQEEHLDSKILGGVSIRSLRTHLHQRANTLCASKLSESYIREDSYPAQRAWRSAGLSVEAVRGSA